MAGLARSVNEQLAEHRGLRGRDGHLGPGNRRHVCLVSAEIAVLTTIGPVHLERMGSLDKILENKAEITESASTVVLNVDDERLARLAERLAPTVRVLRCSAVDAGADVRSSGTGPRHRGRHGRMVAAASSWRAASSPPTSPVRSRRHVLGVRRAIAARLRTMERSQRQNVVVAPSGSSSSTTRSTPTRRRAAASWRWRR